MGQPPGDLLQVRDWFACFPVSDAHDAFMKLSPNTFVLSAARGLVATAAAVHGAGGMPAYKMAIAGSALQAGARPRSDTKLRDLASRRVMMGKAPARVA